MINVVLVLFVISDSYPNDVAIMSQKDPLVIEHGYGKWQFSS